MDNYAVTITFFLDDAKTTGQFASYSKAKDPGTAASRAYRELLELLDSTGKKLDDRACNFQCHLVPIEFKLFPEQQNSKS